MGAGMAALHLVARLPDSLLQVSRRPCRPAAAAPPLHLPAAACGKQRFVHTHPAPPALLQNTVVIDPSGAWLAGWEARQERLAAPHVRTPNTQHPHASPLALADFAVKHGRQQVRRRQAGSSFCHELFPYLCMLSRHASSTCCAACASENISNPTSQREPEAQLCGNVTVAM